MKLDVEGHQMRALRGAEKIIRASKPIIVFEANKPEDSPYKILKNFGYQSFHGFEWFGESGRGGYLCQSPIQTNQISIALWSLHHRLGLNKAGNCICSYASLSAFGGNLNDY